MGNKTNKTKESDEFLGDSQFSGLVLGREGRKKLPQGGSSDGCELRTL